MMLVAHYIQRIKKCVNIDGRQIINNNEYLTLTVTKLCNLPKVVWSLGLKSLALIRQRLLVTYTHTSDYTVLIRAKKK